MALLNRSRRSALVHVAVAIWVVAFAASASAQTKDPRAVQARSLEEKVATIRGALELYRLDLEDGGHKYQLALEGKPLYEERGHHTVSINASYPEGGPARVVLLELGSGGTGCPAFFKVVEVKDDGSTVRSKQFGTCSPMAQSSFKDGVLHITIPKAGGGTESWRYQKGKLSKAPPPPRPKSK